MNAKNLPLKFSILAAMIAVSAWTLGYQGLREGIDLRGGHSLIFEIRSNQPEIERLNESKKGLQAQLADAKTDEEKKRLEGEIRRIDNDLAQLQQDEGGRGLAEEMISVLKERVDPLGLSNTEWRPLSGNRIEIRMPAGKEESQQARRAYSKALDEMNEGNIRRADIRRLTQAQGADRQAEIDRLAKGEASLAGMLKALAESYDRMVAAEAAVAQASGEDQKARAEEAHEAALSDYEGREGDLLALNIKSSELLGVLSNYVPPVEEDALKKRSTEDRKEVAARQERYAEGLKALREKYPARAAQVDKVAKAYEGWAKVRRQLDDPADLKRLIAKAGVLEFRIAPYAQGTSESFAITDAERARLRDILNREGPDGLRKRNERLQWFPIHGEREGYGSLVTEEYGGRKYLLLYNQDGNMLLHKRGAGGWQLANSSPTRDDKNRPAVAFSFDERGAKQFAQLTTEHKGHCMAILLDDEAYSAPVIQSTISSDGIITGRFTDEEVLDLVRTLRAGSLPARLNPDPVSESTFGPGIGRENREMGKRAAYWGLIAVAAFMLIYYLFAGSIADLALVLNIIFVLGAMSLLQAVFTLPGIAGIILTIGMAVDANVLIFERLREEQAKNQTIRMALKNAYERAFSAIFDSNITTLITCAILGWVATEEVKGFAITLGLGVVTSMFTALVVTRWVFQFLLDRGILKSPLFMLHVIGVPRVNWMAKRYWFWGFSGTMIVLGVSSLFWQKSDIWGIEFSAGTQAVVKLNDDALVAGELPNDGIVRDLFVKQAERDGQKKLAATAIVETRLAPGRVDEFLQAYDADGDKRVTLAEWTAAKRNPAFFAKVDADGNGELTREELQKHLPETTYQISTTETHVPMIREVASAAFGKALQIRTGCRFELDVSGRADDLAVPLAPTGLTPVTQTLVRKVRATYRDDLRDFVGGAMFVVRNIQPAITESDFVQRIRDMRFQPDFAGQLANENRVIGVMRAGEEGYSAFLVLVNPADETIREKPEAWEKFASDEWKLVSAALERGEAMVATNFDAAIAGDTAWRAAFAVVLSWLAIIGYLWLRFGNWRWGLAAVLCLVHDTIIVIGLVAVSGWLHEHLIGRLLGVSSFKIDLAMVAAVLTVIGYSVNDTIVVFDRIRENRGKLTTVSADVINLSVNQTLSRTLLTSGTTFLVVLIMYVWGGPGIHAFNYALLAGILFGTYSSVAVASPLLIGFRKALVARVTAPPAE